MSNYTRFIPGEEIDTFKQWDFGAVNADALRLEAQKVEAVATADQAKSDAEIEDARAVGHAAGYAEGFIQGQAQVRLEAQRQITDFIAQQGQDTAQKFVALFATAQAQLDDVEQVISQGVLTLACELARQVLRQELSVNPEALVPVVQEALGQLRADHKSAVIKLNPADCEVLADGAREGMAGMSITLVPDANVTPGGCLVEAAGTVVDGQLEKRWLQAVSALGQTLPWSEPDVPE